MSGEMTLIVADLRRIAQETGEPVARCMRCGNFVDPVAAHDSCPEGSVLVIEPREPAPVGRIWCECDNAQCSRCGFAGLLDDAGRLHGAEHVHVQAEVVPAVAALENEQQARTYCRSCAEELGI